MANPNFVLAGQGAVADSLIDRNGIAYTKAAGTPIASLGGFDASAPQLVQVTNPNGSTYVPAPTGIQLVASTGTLTAGTKYYVLTALTDAGESTPSVEVSFTALINTGIILSWPEVPGATGYKLYGRSTGAELFIATISNGTTLSYHDDGSITPAGALPTLNTAELVSVIEGVVGGTPVATSQGGTDLTASSTGAATGLTETLAGASGKTTYISGFEVTGLGATAASGITITVTGTITGTLSYVLAIPAGVTLGVVPLLVEFARPIPASALNTAIVVNVPSFGGGNALAAATAHGFQL